MISTDQNFNLINVERHDKTLALLNIFITCDFFPTITIPTKISHVTSTLIDNTYVKLSDRHEVSSGVITTHISDHLPVFNLIGKQQIKKLDDKIVKYRKLDTNTIQRIMNYLDTCDWKNKKSKIFDRNIN